MDRSETTLTLIGGPTVLIELDGLRLLTDPTFDPPGEYPGGVLLKKTAGPALTAEQVGPVDAVLLSHDQHADNLDHGGARFLRGRRRRSPPKSERRGSRGTARVSSRSRPRPSRARAARSSSSRRRRPGTALRESNPSSGT